MNEADRTVLTSAQKALLVELSQENRDLLTAYFNQTLPEGEERKVEEALATDADLRNAYEALQIELEAQGTEQ